MRINDKIKEIGDYLSELLTIIPNTLDEYKEIKTRAACERYFEKIIGAVIDLSFLIIKEKSMRIPEEDKEVFEILSSERAISEQLSEKLKEAKGMRNLIAHQYGVIDDEIVFNSIKEELKKDVIEFIQNIKSFRKSK